MMQTLAILITSIYFASSTWATANTVVFTKMENTAFICAEVYAYTTEIGEESELKEGMKAQFDYWRKNFEGNSLSLSVDEFIGRSSLRKRLEAKVFSKDEVVEIMANCEEIRKEIQSLAEKLNKFCLTPTS
jgi:hypothetical protein